MKVYILYSHYYDNCNEWREVVDIFDSEEKAIEARIAEEEDIKYTYPDQSWTSILEWCVK